MSFHEMPESDDDDDDDDNNNDVEPLREDFANIEEADKLLEAAIVFAEEDEYRLWKDNGATSNLRDRGNSRAT